MAALAGAHMLRGDHLRAIAAAKEAIARAQTAGAPAAEAHALVTLGTSTVLSGGSAEGLRLAREAFERTKVLGDAYDDLGRSYANMTSTLLIAGRSEESLERATEGIAWAKSVGAWGGYGRFISGNATEAAIELGRWDEAEALLDDLLVHDAVGVNRMATIAAGGSFLAHRGRIDAADDLLQEGRTLVEPLHEAQFTAPVFIGLVELALVRERPEEASALAAEGIERLHRTEDRYYLAYAERSAKRAAAYAERLAALLKTAESPETFGGRLTTYAAVGAAEATRSRGVPDPGAWQAAVKVSRAGGAWLTAYSRYRLGEALLGAHAPRREAESVMSEAFEEASRLKAAPLVGWIEALARRARVPIQAAPATTAAVAAVDPSGDPGVAADDTGLTTREREVLALVAEGFTNRRIAETLFISESTAGVHVSNILGKLGAASRTEAATIASRLGLVD
jgi:DNA-binding CsgD family transcriptional regulator